MDIGFDVPKIVLFIVFLVLSPKIECQIWMQPTAPMAPLPPIQPTPLCASQFALANHACAMLPFNPVSPPSPPYPQAVPPPFTESDAPESSPTPSHRHRHRHSRRDTPPQQTPVELECCRWLQQIDSGCVCDLLVRLPVFLAKPVHQYTVRVDRSCSVTYSCSGRIISP